MIAGFLGSLIASAYIMRLSTAEETILDVTEGLHSIFKSIVEIWKYVGVSMKVYMNGPSSLVVSITEDLVRALEWVFKRLRIQFSPSANILTLSPCGSNIIWQPLEFLVPIIGVYHRTSEYYTVARMQGLVIGLPRGAEFVDLAKLSSQTSSHCEHYVWWYL